MADYNTEAAKTKAEIELIEAKSGTEFAKREMFTSLGEMFRGVTALLTTSKTYWDAETERAARRNR